MKTSNKYLGLGCTLFAAVMLTGIGAAYAQDDDVAALTTPQSWIGVGVAGVSGDQYDRSIFGQYNGMRDESAYLLLDFDFIKRDDATGTWTNIEGRNLGLDSREASFSKNRQGDWKLGLDYSELVHREIRTVNTGMIGAGTTTPTVVYLPTPNSGADQNFEMKRTDIGLIGEKWINPSLQLQVNFKNEDKDGTRLWGRGYDCASYVCNTPNTANSATNQRWAVLLLPEPVNSNTKQIDVKLNYNTKKLLLTGGYYGSFYTNNNGNVTASVPSVLNSPIGTPATLTTNGPFPGGLQGVLQTPMALQPDNQAHQFYVDGNYAFTPMTRGNFKLAYTHATQNENFGGMGLADGTQPRNDLGGVLDTTLAQFGLTMHPLPKLSVNANLRYEDKKDKTPLAVYNTENGEFWTNSPISSTKTSAKLEGSYLLPANIRGTLGVTYDQIKRTLPYPGVIAAGLSGLRAETDDTGIRGELRRAISESVIGAVSYSYSERRAGNWFSTSGATYGVMMSNENIYSLTGAYPYMLTNSKQDKARVSVDWSASERLSMQFAIEDANNHYQPPTTAGLQSSDMTLYSVDASYVLSDRWKFNAYASQAENKLKTGQNSGYRATLKDTTTAVGAGMTGKLSGRIEVGGKVSYLNDVTQYNFGLFDGNTNAAAINQVNTYGGLPDVTYRETRLNLYGKYALQKNADLRLDVVYFQAKLNEWTWGSDGNQFTYQDNSTVGIDPNQNVTLVGLTYIYKMK
jgi:MtrB/PioB family decaheme-associated outer membrane protein